MGDLEQALLAAEHVGCLKPVTPYLQGPDPDDTPEPCGSCPLCVVIAELDAARVAHRAAVRALSQALGERDRLADGIREHRDYEFPEGSFTPTERFSQAVRASERLWALLDVAGDDPPVPYRALEGSEGGEDAT